MDSLYGIAPGSAGLLIWLIWAVIGIAAALVAQRFTSLRQMLVFNIIVAVAAALIGGYLSIQFVGATTLMLLFISILGAIFAAGIALWIVGSLTMYFWRRR